MPSPDQTILFNIRTFLESPQNLEKFTKDLERRLGSVGVTPRIRLTQRELRRFDQITSQYRTAFPGGINSSAYQEVVRGTRALNQLEDALRRPTTLAGDLGRQTAVTLRLFGGYLVASRAIFAVSGALSSSTREAIQFEREMIKVAQLTNTTADATVGLQRKISSLSQEYGQSVSSIAQASQVLAQAGRNLAEIRTILSDVVPASLAATFGDSIATNVENVEALLAQFNLRASQTGSILDVLNEVTKNFNVSVDELFTGLRRSGAAFAPLAGITDTSSIEENFAAFREYVSLFTSVISVSREGAAIVGTSLRTIFPRLFRPTTRRILEQELQIKLVDEDGRLTDPFEAVRRIFTRLKELNIQGNEPIFQRIVGAVGGDRQFSRVVTLLTQFPRAAKALQIAELESAGSVARDVAIAQENLAVNIEKTKEKFNELIRTVVGSDTFKALAEGALEFSKTLLTITDRLEPLIPLITIIGGAFAARSAISAGSTFFNSFRLGTFASRVGYNQGGYVPSMLTPGEIIVPPSEVKRIGVTRLRQANSTGSYSFDLNKYSVVPGIGNTDTVPLDLQPGSFVLKKRSAQKYFGPRKKFVEGGLTEFAPSGFADIATGIKREFLSQVKTFVTQFSRFRIEVIGRTTKFIESTLSNIKSLLPSQPDVQQQRFPITGGTELTELQFRTRRLPGTLQRDPSVDPNTFIDLNTIKDRVPIPKATRDALRKQAELFGSFLNPSQIGLLAGRSVDIGKSGSASINTITSSLLRAGATGDQINTVIRSGLANATSDKDLDVLKAIGKEASPVIKQLKEQAVATQKLNDSASNASRVLGSFNDSLQKSSIAASIFAGILLQSESEFAQRAGQTIIGGVGGSIAGSAIGEVVGGFGKAGAAAAQFIPVIGAATGALISFISATQDAARKLEEQLIDTAADRISEAKNFVEAVESINKTTSEEGKKEIVDRRLVQGELDQLRPIFDGLSSSLEGSIRSLQGSGPGGALTDADINRALEQYKESLLTSDRAINAFAASSKEATNELFDENVPLSLGVRGSQSANIGGNIDLDLAEARRRSQREGRVELANKELERLAREVAEARAQQEAMSVALARSTGVITDWSESINRSILAINNIGFQFDNLKSSLSDLDSSIAGPRQFTATRDQNIFNDITGLSKNAFEEALRNFEGRLGGNVGGRFPQIRELARGAQFTQNDFRRLFFGNLQGIDPSNTTAGDYLRSLVPPSLGKDVQDVLLTQIDSIFSSEELESLRVSNLISDREQLESILGQVGGGKFDEALKVLADAADKTAERIEFLESNINDLNKQIIDVRIGGNLQAAGTFDRQVDLTREIFQDNRANLGLARFRQDRDFRIRSGGINFNDAINQLNFLNRQGPLSPGQTLQQNRLIEALRTSADETRALSEIQKRANEIEQNKVSARSLTELVATASSEERININRQLADFNFLQRGGTLTGERLSNALRVGETALRGQGIQEQDVRDILDEFLFRGAERVLGAGEAPALRRIERNLFPGDQLEELNFQAQEEFARIADAQRAILDGQLKALDAKINFVNQEIGLIQGRAGGILQEQIRSIFEEASQSKFNRNLERFASVAENSQFRLEISPVTVNLNISAPELAELAESDFFAEQMNVAIGKFITKNAANIAGIIANV